MQQLYCFAAVEFPDDPNVAGLMYWYLCDGITPQAGDVAVAPLGKHNRLQTGVVRKVMFADEFEAPFPMYAIKRVKSITRTPAVTDTDTDANAVTNAVTDTNDVTRAVTDTAVTQKDR